MSLSTTQSLLTPAVSREMRKSYRKPQGKCQAGTESVGVPHFYLLGWMPETTVISLLDQFYEVALRGGQFCPELAAEDAFECLKTFERC
jgi:hypothetical protein